MKRLIHKKGFTLVECVVAMAVLAIMSLMLMTMLEIIVIARNKNTQYEKELDEAIGTLADPNGATPETEPIGDSLNFGDFAIPGNDDPHVDANKNSYGDTELGRIDYDFNEYFQKLPKPEDLSTENVDIAENGAGATGGSYDDGIQKTPNATGTDTVNLTTEDNIEDGTHIITITVSFKSYYNTPERSLKVILPKEAQYMGCSENYQCNVNSSANYSVRIRPNTVPSDYTFGGDVGTGYVEGGFDVKAVFRFKISDEDYNKYYLNPGIYFKGENVNETTENPHKASFDVTL